MAARTRTSVRSKPADTVVRYRPKGGGKVRTYSSPQARLERSDAWERISEDEAAKPAAETAGADASQD